MFKLIFANFGQLQLLAAAFVLLAASVRAISPSAITATVLSEKSGPPEALFGAPYKFQASRKELSPGVHPRIVFSGPEWLEIVGNYAAKRTVAGSWSNHFLRYTWGAFAKRLVPT